MKFNQYDIYIILLLFSVGAGRLGGTFCMWRMLSILFLPLLMLCYKKALDSNLRIIIKVVFFFFVYSAVSMLWTPAQESVLVLQLNLFFQLSFCIELIVFARLSRQGEASVVNGWVLAFLFTAIIALWEYQTGNHLSVSKYEDESLNADELGNLLYLLSASATFYNPNEYITFVCFSLPFLFGFVKKNGFRGDLGDLLVYVPVILSAYILLRNASRGGLLSVLVIAGYFLFYGYGKKRSKTTLYVIIGMVAVSFYFIWDTINENFLARSEMLDNVFDDNIRMKIWQCGLEVSYNYNLLGCGIGGAETAYKETFSPIPAPHNLFLEILVEYGVVFLVLLVLGLFKMFKSVLNEKDDLRKFLIYAALLSIPFATVINSSYLILISPWAYMSSLIFIITKKSFKYKSHTKKKYKYN